MENSKAHSANTTHTVWWHTQNYCSTPHIIKPTDPLTANTHKPLYCDGVSKSKCNTLTAISYRNVYPHNKEGNRIFCVMMKFSMEKWLQQMLTLLKGLETGKKGITLIKAEWELDPGFNSKCASGLLCWRRPLLEKTFEWTSFIWQNYFFIENLEEHGILAKIWKMCFKWMLNYFIWCVYMPVIRKCFMTSLFIRV